MLKAKLAFKRLFLHQFRLGLVWVLHKPSVAVFDAVCDDIRAAKGYCADDIARVESCDVHGISFNHTEEVHALTAACQVTLYVLRPLQNWTNTISQSNSFASFFFILLFPFDFFLSTIDRSSVYPLLWIAQSPAWENIH